MGSFVEDLWSSIFTAGPTPTLLLATNVSFAALQTLLFALLLATYSIHFVILSILSGSLWYSINWFAREVKQVQQNQAAEQEKESGIASVEERKTTHSDVKPRGTSDGADSDTETESLIDRKTIRTPNPALRSTTGYTTLQVPGSSSEARKRLSVGGDSSGYTSTDSEWEKVDENTN